MKKLAFSTSLIAVALLASCGANKAMHNINALKSNKSFSLSSNDTTPWYEYDEWWKYCSSGIEGEEATEEDIGKLVPLTVNGQVHQVRLIDVDKDVDNAGETIHTTFEFYNLISDANGNSLTTLYNDVSDTTSGAYDFLNSTIRKALNNTGSADHFLWAQKGQTTWSTTYENETVLSMLPEELSKVIKPVKKMVNTRVDNSWVETEFIDKLFLLSPSEMGYTASETEGEPYTYYEDATKQTKQIRVKKQVKTDEKYTNVSYIPVGSGQTYGGQIFNEAGQNYEIGDSPYSAGAEYMLRSPEIAEYYVDFWTVSAYGECNDIPYYFVTYPVAPAFCI